MVHRDLKTTASNLQEVLLRHLAELKKQSLDEMMEKRYQRLMSFGAYSDEEVK